MKRLTFDRFFNNRKKFLIENANSDHIVMEGKNNILISAPHGVPQIRNGKNKVQEIGSLATALYIQEATNSFLIAKTKCNNDDANFDENSEYKNTIRDLIKKHNIKYILDFHGLASYRNCDINLGIHLGENIKNNTSLFDKLNKELLAEGFNVSIDRPFMAGPRTISGSMIKEFNDIWTLQIEINCKITNRKGNFELTNKLLQVFLHWINSINT